MTLEVRLEIKPRNNLILTRMSELGIKNVAELCRRMGGEHNQQAVGSLINLKSSPLKKNSSATVPLWTKTASAIADALLCRPEDIFSENLRYLKLLKEEKIHVEVDVQDMSRLGGIVPSQLQIPATQELDAQIRETKEALNLALKSLKPQFERVMRLRFGLDDGEERTLHEIGQELGLSSERIRQIVQRSLRKIRHPKVLRRVRQAVPTGVISGTYYSPDKLK